MKIALSKLKMNILKKLFLRTQLMKRFKTVEKSLLVTGAVLSKINNVTH